MALLDLPLEKLKEYHSPAVEPADFDTFWQNTLAEARQYPLNPRFEAVEVGLRNLETYDVTFNGYDGQPIKGWLLLPRHHPDPLPCVVEYVAYGGGRGFLSEWLLWSAAGYAHFIMDSRGQGSVWRSGDTPDITRHADNPQFPGCMTRGVLNPQTYYYQRLMSDAVRALEAVRTHPRVDGQRVALTGQSQGGGVALAVAALEPDIAAVMADVPFLCDMRVATELTNAYPYEELVRYCKVHRDKVETVFQTLGYFDGVHFARRATAKALFSVALMDDICPPRTVFAAYNVYGGEKDIKVWTYNQHEGGEAFQHQAQLAFLDGIMGIGQK